MSDRDRCGAECRDGTPCEAYPVQGADRCRMHGGKGSGAPEGNSNGVVTGEHETIAWDTLSEEEQALWQEVDTNHLAQVNKQIRMNKIRQRRMLARIEKLKGEGMTKVRRETEEGDAGEGHVDMTREASEDEVERIQRIEEALTRVQKELRKLLREKYRILKDQPADNSEKLDELLSRMASMRDEADSYESPSIDE